MGVSTTQIAQPHAAYRNVRYKPCDDANYARLRPSHTAGATVPLSASMPLESRISYNRNAAPSHTHIPRIAPCTYSDSLRSFPSSPRTLRNFWFHSLNQILVNPFLNSRILKNLSGAVLAGAQPQAK